MADVCRIERAIGETRACVYHKRQAMELYVRRWSEEKLPRVGEVFSGRVRAIDNQLMAAFVDLGIKNEAQGLLRFTLSPDAPRLLEGQMVRVEILREAEANKGPLIKFIELSDATDIIKEKSVSLEDMIKARFADIRFEDGVVQGVDWAWEPEVALKSGGNIFIEHTRAGTMVDVDTGAGPKVKTGVEAARQIVRQVRLRGIGGLILIDFPNFRKNKDRQDVWKTLEDGFKNDPNPVKLAPFSRFGTVEIVRTRHGKSIAQTLMVGGQFTSETTAITGLRRLMTEASVHNGAKLVLALPEHAYEWLEAGHIDWKLAVADKIGARFRLTQASKLDVYVDEA